MMRCYDYGKMSVIFRELNHKSKHVKLTDVKNPEPGA